VAAAWFSPFLAPAAGERDHAVRGGVDVVAADAGDLLGGELPLDP